LKSICQNNVRIIKSTIFFVKMVVLIMLQINFMLFSVNLIHLCWLHVPNLNRGNLLSILLFLNCIKSLSGSQLSNLIMVNLVVLIKNKRVILFCIHWVFWLFLNWVVFSSLVRLHIACTLTHFRIHWLDWWFKTHIIDIILLVTSLII